MDRLGNNRVSELRNLEKSIKKERDPNAVGRLHGDDSVGNVRQIEFLRKMVELSRSRGARVVFLNLPLYRDEVFFDVPYFKNLLKTEFSDVEFWDYADFPIPDDCRQDINHLNRWGAEIFSRELAARMKREGMLPPPPRSKEAGETFLSRIFGTCFCRAKMGEKPRRSSLPKNFAFFASEKKSVKKITLRRVFGGFCRKAA